MITIQHAVSNNCATNLRHALLSSGLTNNAAALESVLSDFSAAEISLILYDWHLWGRPEQLAPERAKNGDAWSNWLYLGGRGSGKTRSGAEWIKELAYKKELAPARFALVGNTIADVRDVMVHGESGLIACHSPSQRPKFIASRNMLVWPNGSLAECYSSQRPSSLRGPQFHAAWCDELAKWRYDRETWDMLKLAVRLGTHPQTLITTTPRPTKLIKELISDAANAYSHSSTQDNQANLAPGFLKEVVKRYGGGTLGKQELDGEIVEENSNALWNLDQINRYRVAKPRCEFRRTVIAIDPPAGGEFAVCGMVVASITENDHVYVLQDASLVRPSPGEWAARAASLWADYEANLIVAEINQGGDMVKSALLQASSQLVVKERRAHKSKWLRAEPVARRYATGHVHHVGIHTELEREMIDFDSSNKSHNRSPDRLDALVWAITELYSPAKEPRTRSIF